MKLIIFLTVIAALAALVWTLGCNIRASRIAIEAGFEFADCFLDALVAASVGVFIPEALKDPLGRMPLLLGRLLVGVENLDDRGQKRFTLRPLARRLPAVTGGVRRARRSSGSCDR